MEFYLNDLNDLTNEELEALRKENSKAIANATTEEIDDWLKSFEIKFIGYSDQEKEAFLNNESQMEGLLHLCFGVGWDEITIEKDEADKVVILH